MYGWMMSASSIGAGRGGGYARYLEGKTVAPERGDYYLIPVASWRRRPATGFRRRETLARLGVDPGVPVDGGDFIALMEGRHPGPGGGCARPARTGLGAGGSM